MTHLETGNLLAAYLDGALNPAQTVQVEDHLAGCTECREMVEDARLALDVCQAAEDREPVPWLVPRILRATIGETRPSWAARFRAWLRPQLVYGISMAVFSTSFVLFAAKVNLRHLTISQVNPAAWFHHADSRTHVFAARAEKFYYDLRFVYEVQSVLRDFGQQPRTPQKSRQPAGSSFVERPGGARLALAPPPPSASSNLRSAGRAPREMRQPPPGVVRASQTLTQRTRSTSVISVLRPFCPRRTPTGELKADCCYGV